MSDWMDRLRRTHAAYRIDGDHGELADALISNASELIDRALVSRTQSKTIDILNRERSQYAAERDNFKGEVERLREAIIHDNRRSKDLTDDYIAARDENVKLRDLIQEVIDHDETTGWGQNKLAAALKLNEPETKPEGHRPPKPQLPPNRIIREDSAKPEGDT